MSPSQVSPSRKKRTGDSHSSQPAKKQKKNVALDVKTAEKGKKRDSEFQVVSATLSVSVPPVFSGNPQGGVEEMLDSLIMRYIPSLDGVVIAHSNLEFTNKAARIQSDCPFLICNIKFDATVWKPSIGSKMKGRVILSSPDHVSLLVHRTFNVSIPRHHIPSSLWEFEYGPAENDPEYAPEEVDEEGASKPEEASTGKWVNCKSGERLGGEDRKLEFTVIGLTVANEMLSLVGSIQPDPFSPRHKAYGPTPTASKEHHEEPEIASDDSSDDDEEEDAMQLLKRKAASPPPEKEEKTPKSKKKKRKTVEA